MFQIYGHTQLSFNKHDVLECKTVNVTKEYHNHIEPGQNSKCLNSGFGQQNTKRTTKETQHRIKTATTDWGC